MNFNHTQHKMKPLAPLHSPELPPIQDGEDEEEVED